MKKQFFCKDATETEKIAAAIAAHVGSHCTIALSGELGAGKTTFARGFLRALGHRGSVKSPTYTIVEPYEGLGDLGDIKLFHFDLYRIGNIEELELMGIRDYFTEEAIILIEWPERGAKVLPEADLACYIEHHGEGRLFTFKASTERGKIVLSSALNGLSDEISNGL